MFVLFFFFLDFLSLSVRLLLCEYLGFSQNLGRLSGHIPGSLLLVAGGYDSGELLFGLRLSVPVGQKVSRVRGLRTLVLHSVVLLLVLVIDILVHVYFTVTEQIVLKIPF